MGVLNVTPDSFSDGGQFSHTDAAVSHALQMCKEGADILDIGGESTRPATFHDSSPLPAAEEMRRVLPVIVRLAADLQIPISIDTYKASVARAALDSGAQIVNDISGLQADPDMAPLIAERGVPVILMHLPGMPRHLPQNPEYADVLGEVRAFFVRQIEYARSQGVKDSQIWLDPGIGFGKTAQHNLELLRRLGKCKWGFRWSWGPRANALSGAFWTRTTRQTAWKARQQLSRCPLPMARTWCGCTTCVKCPAWRRSVTRLCAAGVSDSRLPRAASLTGNAPPCVLFVGLSIYECAAYNFLRLLYNPRIAGLNPCVALCRFVIKG